MRTKSSAPYVTVTVETDVEVEPEDLEAAGWVFVGEGAAQASALDRSSAVTETLRAWHDETHEGPWRFCSERPCLDLRDVYLTAGVDL